MKVLLLAPHPFFQERGTPIATRLLAQTLSEQGHRVDLLTYHEGEDVSLPGVRVFRIPAPPGLGPVGIGLSVRKLVCDAFLAVSLAVRLWRERYDVIHAVEESVYLAAAARVALGIPYVYDMDSSLADQILESRPRARPLGPFLHYMERRAVRGAAGVTVVCDALARKVRRADPEAPLHVIEDIAIGNPSARTPPLRKELGIDGPMLLYVGNLESYQGIDLMLDAFAAVVAGRRRVHLVVVGGQDDHIEAYRARTRELGLEGRVHWAGPRPAAQLPGLLAQADVLLSPRITGVNTPMKVYSYLASGVPTVATRILSHTQVLHDGVAALADPTPQDYARAIDGILADPAGAKELGDRALDLANREFNRDAYRRKVAAFYADLAERRPAARAERDGSGRDDSAPASPIPDADTGRRLVGSIHA